MKAFFRDTFEYTFHFNDKVLDLMIESGEMFPEKSLQLINHTLNAHQIWNARIEQKTHEVQVWDIRPWNILKAINKENSENTLKILDDSDLNKRIVYKTSKGEQFENTTQEILFHIVNHSTYHRGQIASDCKQHGIIPLVTDYIFYKRN